jgi:hypothetical protein
MKEFNDYSDEYKADSNENNSQPSNSEILGDNMFLSFLDATMSGIDQQ